MKDSELVFGLIAAFDKSEYNFEDFRYLTEPFGVSESNLRTCLSRMVKKGTLTSERRGKGAVYRLSEKGGSISRNVALGFKTADYKTWNESFWGVVFSVPEVKAEYRHKIRKKLIKYRFACMYPGFWLRPVNEAEDIPKALSSVTDLGYCKLIRFYNQTKMTSQEAKDLWNTDEINEEMKRGLKLLEEQMQAVEALDSRQALIQKMHIGDEMVGILFKDPLLPEEFLPKDWAGNELRNKFFEFDRKVTQISEPYWKQIFVEE